MIDVVSKDDDDDGGGGCETEDDDDNLIVHVDDTEKGGRGDPNPILSLLFPLLQTPNATALLLVGILLVAAVHWATFFVKARQERDNNKDMMILMMTTRNSILVNILNDKRRELLSEYLCRRDLPERMVP